ncbi:MAG: ABATE domain-containing protein [Ilumatobacteraceae bacterium]
MIGVMGNRIPAMPLLGEPLLVELANTLYVDQSATIDFFAHRAWIAAWFVQASSARELVVPARITEAQADELRHLRDAVRTVFTTVERNGGQVPSGAVDAINDLVRRSSASVVIDWRRGDRPRAVVDTPGGAFGVLLATLAARCVAFVTGPDLTHVQRCSRPECHMLFFQQHHRRRYCNPRCANADRQSRYYQRVTARPPTGTPSG